MPIPSVSKLTPQREQFATPTASSRFLLSYLQGSVAPTDVVAALASRKAALSERAARMERCVSIDQSLDAMKPASELRDASRQMGRQVLRIAAQFGRALCLAWIDG